MRFQAPVPGTFNFLLDLTLHLILLICSGIIGYSTIDSNQRYYVKSVEDLLVKGRSKLGTPLGNVSDVPSLTDWISKKLGYVLSNYPGFFGDGNSIYITSPTLRQVRIVNGTCFTGDYQRDPKIKVRMAVQRCNSQSGREDTVAHYTYWSNYTAFNSTGFLYTPYSLTGLSAYHGKYDSYSGGGYLVSLGTDWAYITSTLKYLKTYGWWDHLTRAVFVEFALYNPNANLMGFVRVAFETPATGGVTSELKITTFPLVLRYRYTWALLVTSTVIGVIVSILQMVLEVWKMREWGMKKYVGMFRAQLTWLSIALFLVVVGLGFEFIASIYNIMETVQAGFSVDNYKDILTATDEYRCFLVTGGFLMVVMLLKLTCFLTWHRGCRILLLALKQATSVILAFTMMAFMLFMAFSSGFYLLVVDRMSRFSTVFESMEATLQEMFGVVDLSELAPEQSHIFMALRVTFVCIFVFFILTMFMSIMIRIYSDVRQQLFYAGNKFTVLQVLREKAARFTGIESSEVLTFPNITPSEHACTALNLRMALILHNLDKQKQQHSYFGKESHPTYF